MKLGFLRHSNINPQCLCLEPGKWEKMTSPLYKEYIPYKFKIVLKCGFYMSVPPRQRETGQENKDLVLKRTELTFVEKVWQLILLERP